MSNDAEPLTPLTPKQQAFVEQYLVDFNGTQAAIRAGYSEKTADQQGSRLLTNVKVQQAILAHRKKLTSKVTAKAQDVLDQFIAIGFANIGDILDFSGTELKTRKACDISPRALEALQSIKVRRYVEGSDEDAKTVEIIEFRMHSKIDALKEVARRVEVSGDGQPLPDQRIDVTSGGKPIERCTLLPADLVETARLLGLAIGDLQPVGGPKPVDPGIS